MPTDKHLGRKASDLCNAGLRAYVHACRLRSHMTPGHHRWLLNLHSWPAHSRDSVDSHSRDSVDSPGPKTGNHAPQVHSKMLVS